MAVAAQAKLDPWTGSQTTYLFAINTANGSIIGYASKYIHGSTSDYKMLVLNQGLVMYQSNILAVLFADFNPAWADQKGWSGGLCN